MGVFANAMKQVATFAAPAKQTLVSSKAILSKNVLVVGDDLAVKTERSLGIKPEREGHALFRSSMGALRNRLIIWPVALGISAVFPAAIGPALMAGSAYLCYEVAHTLHDIWHKHKHKGEAGHEDAHEPEITDESYEEFERHKINSFIRTDFVMAMETTAIGMGQIADVPLVMRAISLSVAGVSLLAGVSVAVFGLLKLDDIGAYLARREGEGFFAKGMRAAGNGILRTAPTLMKGLAAVGIGAMALVGGNILVHDIPALHSLSETFTHAAHTVPYVGGALAAAAPIAVSVGTALATGFATLAAKPYLSAIYNRTVQPAINLVKEFGSKARSWLPARTKTHDQLSAPAAETPPPVIEHKLDITDKPIGADTPKLSAEMAKAASTGLPPPDTVNDNRQDVLVLTNPVSKANLG